jgi:hypothetical protein
MRRLGRLSDVKNTLLIASVIVLAAGCGGHAQSAAKPQKPSASPGKACDPADDSCIPTGKPSAIAVPALEVGKTMPLQLPSSNGTTSLDITLTGLKTKPRTSVDPKGTQELCFGFKLKNTGTVAYKADDLTAGMSWQWFGLDGEQADTGAGTAGVCDELGHEFAGLDGPAPLPGKYVTGYYNITVPTKPGALEVTDSEDSPLFRLNYGPQSAQVPIDARGQ